MQTEMIPRSLSSAAIFAQDSETPSASLFPQSSPPLKMTAVGADASSIRLKESRESAEAEGFETVSTPEKLPLKEDITGFLGEEWHYRYVGRNHAEKMKELDMCLEEYLDWLGTLDVRTE